MTNIDTLIRDLEGANRGSPELNVRVDNALCPEDTRERHKWESVARYTTSLDAALSLVPEGANWLIGTGGVSDDPDPYRADVHYDKEVGWGNGLANTPALALCIAALKARSAA